MVALNVVFCAYLLGVLYLEICEWARQTKLTPRGLLKPLKCIQSLMVKQSEARRSREPRVELDASIDQVQLKASGSSKSHGLKRRLKRYGGMQAKIHLDEGAPPRSGQRSFTETVSGVYDYYLNQLDYTRLSGSMAIYVVRQSLVSHYIETTEGSQVTKLSDVSEELFPKVVDLYRIRNEAEEKAANAKKERMKLELEAFYAGK